MGKLDGKIAVVTGASSGMGREIAKAYATEGAKVVAVARRKEKLEELAGEFPNIVAFSGDMAKPEDVTAMLDYAVTEFGKLDILVNNAGILDNFMPVGDLTDELWERVLRVNLTAPMEAMRKAVNIFLESGGGVIINIASVGGLRGAAGGATYVTSKHALVGLTKNTAIMYAEKGIRANVICPGGVETEIGNFDQTKISPLGIEKVMKANAVNPRTGKPEEVAKVAVFLATDDASFVNGVAMPVDGGWMAG
ncbi:glucose 1-dehydrogenase [Ohessyouella blattaphilus]|uniref:Glucose 1-dehydrogenase n=1 Tax=Ohessyouella blattaphilus TaxID=2949333 RepID=A0ABT1EDZ2_9FIRM|nr:glucose 1-dehydrogenase [Ohessyouella blattaphilus]MCP1108853.1 glucose 1-dehydrogenase [Ohessyouella blattaphilus]MCR8562247.1 glucose 1-dehydrogenase [Ohessyouella blattaphilus]MDL2249096.1 glucose 1-dehydrogenase [Lachnospiraceae bacterium OttesenSCG-928-J05]